MELSFDAINWNRCMNSPHSSEPCNI
jgi:hypothetical protein